MLASSTPFAIHDENAVSMHKSSMKSVSRRVFYEDDETPQKSMKIGTSTKTVSRRALGDLSSSQVNQRISLAITPGPSKSVVSKPVSGSKHLSFRVADIAESIAKPEKAKEPRSSLKSTSKSVVETFTIARDEPKQLDDEIAFDTDDFICSRKSKQTLDVYDMAVARSETIHYIIEDNTASIISGYEPQQSLLDNSWVHQTTSPSHLDASMAYIEPVLPLPMLSEDLDIVEW